MYEAIQQSAATVDRHRQVLNNLLRSGIEQVKANSTAVSVAAQDALHLAESIPHPTDDVWPAGDARTAIDSTLTAVAPTPAQVSRSLEFVSGYSQASYRMGIE